MALDANPLLLAEEITSNLRSAATTTAQTLKSLRALLGEPGAEKSVKPLSKPTANSKKDSQDTKSKSAPKRHTKNAKSTISLNFEIFESRDRTEEPLTPARKRKLATEAFNTSLKCLSENVKRRQDRKRDNGLSAEKTPARGKTSRPTPLQQCSPNRKSKPVRMDCKGSTVPEDIDSVADCAITALDCLHQINANEQKENSGNDQKLEQGALVMIEKLISLEMMQRSTNEMSKLYEQYWKRRKNSQHIKASEPRPSGQTSGIDICTKFITEVKDKSTLTFVTSYQSQVLRLLILLGSQAITEDFVACLGLDHAGSPACTILEGFESGLLDKDKTAQQLRTVAQALIKLYSTSASDKKACKENSGLNLVLLCEALSIKCRSWSLLCHKPDLTREYWGLISKALKRFDTDYGDHRHDALELCIRQIRFADSALLQNGFESTVPMDIIYVLMDIAENRGCNKDTLGFIHEHLHCADTLATEAQAILKWRIVTMRYRTSSNRDGQLLDCLEKASASFDTLDAISIEYLEAVLLHVARLRKTVLAIFLDIGSSIKATKSGDKDIIIQSQCVKIVSSLLDLQSDLMQRGEISGAVQTGFAKTFEAMLGICKSHLKQPSFIPAEHMRSIERCMEISGVLLSSGNASTLSSQVTRFVQSLLVQVSNLYWMRYLERCDEITPVETKDLLERSCRAISNLSAEIQRSASFIVKLEKLALVHLNLQSRDAARECFAAAVKHHIASGALDEATSTALSHPSHVIWSKKGSKSYLLGKALQSHAQICLTYELKTQPDKSWIYDEPNLAPTHRLALLEAQIMVAFEHEFSHDQLEAFTKHVCNLVKSCHTSQLLVYCLRFLGYLLGLQSKNQTVCLDNVFNSDHVQNLIQTTVPAGSDALLASFARSTHDQVNIQHIMHYGCQDISRLEKHIASLCSVILEAPDWSSLETCIDNVDFLTKQLQSTISYGRAVANTQIVISCLNSIRHILKLCPAGKKTQVVDVLTQLACLHHQTGNTFEAGRIFAEAEKLLAEEADDMIVMGRWTFAYVQYLADVSSTTKAVEVFLRAIQQFEKYQRSSESFSGRRRLERDSLISSSALVASLLAFRAGQLEQANAMARQSVKLSSAIWQAIEKPTDIPSELSSAHESEMALSVLTGEMSNLTISSDQGVKQPKCQGSSYWAFVDLHCSALHHMTEMSMHNGLYQDAVYYAEQLKKISFAVNSHVREMRATTLLALVYAKAGHEIQASNLLENFKWLRLDLDILENRWSALQYAEVLVEIENCDQAGALLDAIEAHPVPITRPAPTEQPPKTGIKKAPLRGKAKATRPTKLPPKRPGQQAIIDSEVCQSAEVVKGQTYFQARQNEKCTALRNRIVLLSKNVPSTSLTPGNTRLVTDKVADSSVTTAMIMLERALHEFSSDSVKCVLSETAVALPVRYKSARKSGRVSFIQVTEDTAAAKTPKSSRGRSVAPKKPQTEASVSTGENLVIDAQKLLHSVQSKGKSSYPSDMLHLAHKVQSRLALLSSAVNAPFAVSSLEMVLQSLVPKDLIQYRHQLTIKAERATREKAQILAWPDLTSLQDPSSELTNFDCTMDDLAGLPRTWSLVSISLAENQQEIILSKVVSNRSPFVLRIPLSRSDVEIDEDFNFTFAEAKEELFDIITNANTSAHDRRGQGSKEARKEWYAEREALDQRLQSWLSNIEGIWLGGFRGLLSSSSFDDDLTTKFGQNVNRILDKHLPSRRKSGKTNKDKVVLHAHVFELFLGLGDPEEQDIDDAVTDLLYFVVDILQFNGERNAYDEIDFDAILVDVLDELRSCHSIIAQIQQDGSQHTILIVDKEMASFPWESLPCLKDQAVSRMPSLSSVIQRLQKVRPHSSAAEGFIISRNHGSYMLNPSGDLVSTQSTFEPILQSQLPDFQGIVGEPPTESAFSSALTDNELFLYFGHGSGAQHIRGRTIRNLDNCAVTLLMGCSSSKMTECGKFESYGMPDYYISGMSGCMAVVGTLWDVTDRDIDRFALSTMVEWGLLEEDDNVTQAMRKSSRKVAKDAKMQTSKNGCRKSKTSSLDAAVNKGRDACMLRYLNGAAPVVYGIPVFLH